MRPDENWLTWSFKPVWVSLLFTKVILGWQENSEVSKVKSISGNESIFKIVYIKKIVLQEICNT